MAGGASLIVILLLVAVFVFGLFKLFRKVLGGLTLYEYTVLKRLLLLNCVGGFVFYFFSDTRIMLIIGLICQLAPVVVFLFLFHNSPVPIFKRILRLLFIFWVTNIVFALGTGAAYVAMIAFAYFVMIVSVIVIAWVLIYFCLGKNNHSNSYNKEAEQLEREGRELEHDSNTTPEKMKEHNDKVLEHNTRNPDNLLG